MRPSQGEKSSWRVAPVPDFRSMKGFNLFQLSALKNTDYITASNRPPMYSCASKASKKYVCSRCGEAVESGSVHFCLEIVKRTDF